MLLIYGGFKYKIYEELKDKRKLKEVFALKKLVAVIIVLAVIAIYPTTKFLIINSKKNTAHEDTSAGVSVLDSYAGVSVEKVDKAIAEAKKKQEELNQIEAIQGLVEKQIKLIESGKLSYRKVFSNVYIAGDSLMEGLEAYGVLNSSHIFAKVSASLSHLESVMPNIISVRPPVLILHYGLNMIGDQEYHVDSFISQYTKDIQKLRKSLPDTRIIVSLLFPVDTSVATANRFKYVSRYNNRLIKMSKELGVEYLDSSSIFVGHDFYGADGIHLSYSFYNDYWLKFIMREMEIYA